MRILTFITIDSKHNCITYNQPNHALILQESNHHCLDTVRKWQNGRTQEVQADPEVLVGLGSPTPS